MRRGYEYLLAFVISIGTDADFPNENLKDLFKVTHLRSKGISLHSPFQLLKASVVMLVYCLWNASGNPLSIKKSMSSIFFYYRSLDFVFKCTNYCAE